MRILRCIVKGESELALRCIRELNDSGHSLAGIIASNDTIVQQAMTWGVPVFPSCKLNIEYDIILWIDGFLTNEEDFTPKTRCYVCYSNKKDLEQQRAQDKKIAWRAIQNNGSTLVLEHSFYIDKTKRLRDYYFDAVVDSLMDLMTSLAREELPPHVSSHPMPQSDLIESNIFNDLGLFERLEIQTILHNWNNTQVLYPYDKTIHQLFEEQVEKTPAAIAVVFEEEQLTYQELNQRANQVARCIREKYEALTHRQLPADTLIGICVERSLEMIVGVLAILKSGGAYVPIDPDYPEQRIGFILQDIQAELVLTQTRLVKRLEQMCRNCEEGTKPKSEVNVQALCWIAVDDFETLDPYEEQNLKISSSPKDLAYVIYTSGSTGAPKGVMIEHHSLSNFAHHQQQLFKPNTKVKLLQFSSLCFDASVFEIFVALISGSQLFVVSERMRQDATALADYIASHQITLAILPPALGVVIDSKKLESITTLLFGGESCPLSLLESYYQKGRCLFNAYGPTESTVMSSAYLFEITNDSPATIGHALANTQLYVLGEGGMPCPVGVSGELYIGGVGLARGYLNNPDLTQQKFITNPFSGCPSERLYKTGDLVRWLPDGNLEYIGRLDSQVKLRGYRIELGEIESELNKIPQVEQSIVVLNNNPDSQQDNKLVAYVTLLSRFDDRNTLQELRSLFASSYPIWWPSVSDYGYYDDFIYETLTHNELRKPAYLRAFSRHVKNKVVLDVGTGKDAFLARLCLACGAQKVYGVELLSHAARQARESLSQDGLSDRIEIIEGDIRFIHLPEKVDICVSQLIGVIGSAEGVIPTLNAVRKKHLTPKGIMLPKRAKTYIVGAQLPEAAIKNPNFSPVSAHYVENIFKAVGKSFDLRLCLLNFSNQYIVTDKAEFEALDFSHYIEINHCSTFTLQVKQAATLNALVLWSSIFIDEEIVLDAEADGFTRLPIVFVLNRTYSVKPGDYLVLECVRTQAPTGSSCDYHVQGYWASADGFRENIDYLSEYVPATYGDRGIYSSLFKNKMLQVESTQSSMELKDYFRNTLSQFLPEYMLPNQYVILDKFPLTLNGKIDKKALPQPDEVNQRARTPLFTKLAVKLAEIWSQILKLDGDMLYQESDFFDLGGHSLNASQLVMQIQQQLGLDCSLRVLFQYPILQDLARYLETQLKAQAGPSLYDEFSVIPNTATQYEPFALSEVQQAYWVGRQQGFEGGGVGTHVYFELLFKSLDIPRLESAWNRLISHHPMLRVVFEGNQQRCLAQVPVYVFAVQDTQALSQQQQQSSLMAWRDALSHQLFDPGVYPLFDIRVTRCHEGDILHFSFDALMLDGMSMQHLLRSLFELYITPETVLAPLAVTFRDYQQTLAQINQSSFYEADQAYWLSRIPDLPFGPELPINAAVLSKPARFQRITQTIDKHHWDLFKEKAQQHKVSLTSAVSALYGLVLGRWSHSPHFLINLTLFNRLPLHTQVNEILGDFTTLELLEFNGHASPDFATLVQQTHAQLWQDLDHRLFTGVAVQRELLRQHQLPFTRAIAPVVLTSVLGAGQNNLFSEGFTSEFIKINYSISQTPQTWIDHQAHEEAGGFVAQWDYLDGLVPTDMMQAMHAAYCALITYYAEHEWSAVIPDVLPARDGVLIAQANAAIQALPQQLLQEGFLLQALHQPLNPAVVTSSRTLSYAELEQLTLKAAHQLTALDEPLIAIVMEKGLEQVIAMLGILRSGRAYLPINACWPEGRIEAVLAEGRVQTVLTQSWVLARCAALKPYRCHLVDGIPPSEPVLPLINEKHVSPNDLAYVIFTSGSTGTPKGVAISHQSAMNTIAAVNQNFEISAQDKVLAISDFSFDLSVYDVLGLLTAGGTVVIPDADKIKEPNHWVELIESHGITVWNSVPTFMQMLVEHALSGPGRLSSVKTVLLSGDWIEPGLVPTLQSLLPQAQLRSLGGATEAAIWSVWYDMTHLDNKWSSVPYGTAMPNQQLWILNEAMEASPVGVPGDIYIGGAGLALSYWHDTEKTQAQFVTHPKTHERLYRTGDLGAWHSDGVIQFQGRADQQVKIAGHRVELGEIEQTIQNIEGITACVTEFYPEPTPQLVAYVTYEPTEASPISRPVPISYCVDVQARLKDIDFTLGITRTVDDVTAAFDAHELDELYRHAVLQLFDELHVFATPNSSFSVAQLIQATGILPRYEKWLRRALDALVEFGDLKEENHHYKNDKPLMKADERVFQSFEGVKDFQVFLDNARRLKSFLLEDASAEFYVNTVDKLFYQQIFNAQYKVIDAFLAALSPNRVEPITILEVGAGTGSLAEVILKSCYHEQDRYIFTDISNYFLNEIKKNHPNNPKLVCQLYNLDVNPKLQGLQSHSIDLIIANDVLHDVKDVKKTFQFLSRLLKPGGMILFVEIVKFYKFHDLVMGLITGFESFEDNVLRPVHPLLSTSQWDVVGQEANFSTVRWINHRQFPQMTECDMAIGLFALRNETIYQLDTDKLQQVLAQRLSDYMVPRCYIELDAFPLSLQGKLDRKALPKPNQDAAAKINTYVAPQTAIEKQLCLLCEATLKISPIGCMHHFFQIGGDSLLAVQLSSAITKALKIECPTKAIFDYPILQDLARYLEKQSTTSLPSIHKVSRRKPMPLSHSQQRLWFLNKYAEGRDLSYLMGAVFELFGQLDVAALTQSIDFLMKRHEGLRTIFIEKEGIGYQQFLPLKAFKLNMHSIAPKELTGCLESLWRTPFNLSAEPLIEWHLFKMRAKHHVLTIKIHHIISDGWSMMRLLRELEHCYTAFTQHKKPAIIPLPFQYVDFAVWQRQWLKEGVIETQESYWKTQLANAPFVLDLPLDYPRPAALSSKGDSVSFTINADVMRRLEQIASSEGVTLFMVLLTGLSIVLHRYSRQSDFLIGTAIAGRGLADLEAIQGFFVNTLALRQHIAAEDTVSSLLKKVKQTCVAAYEHQDLPFEYLVDKLDIPRDPSRHPLVQVMVSHLQRKEQSVGLELPDIQVKPLSMNMQTAQFDLTFFLMEGKDELSVTTTFNTTLFKKETVERLQVHLMQLYTQLDRLNTPIYQLDMLLPQEKQMLLHDWNNTSAPYPQDKTIHQLFEEQVEKTPNNFAAIYEDTQLTYRELNARANQLAHYLIKHYQVQPDDLIALCLERSEQMLIAILGVLKSGGAYVPIDPDYPDERINYILKDTQSKVILSNDIYQTKLNNLPGLSFSPAIVAMDSVSQQRNISKELKANPGTNTESANLAYVIYTSGSTGQPKGVMITHNNVVNYCHWIKDKANFIDVRLDCSSSFAFDFTVTTSLAGLLQGASIVLCSNDCKLNMDAYINHLIVQQINMIKLTPSYFSILVENQTLRKNSLPALHTIILGGEPVRVKDVKIWSKLYPDCRLINEYGPTETTVGITSFTDFKNKVLLDSRNSVPLGKVAINNCAYVLDNQLTPLPIGAIGELYISGKGLARGYLNQSKLTAEKFLANPFQTEKEKKQGWNATLYKTGDMVRYLPDGHLEYIGRNDFQVKIRGYRIELGEIEHSLLAYDGIKQSIVVAKEKAAAEGGSKYLAAYYVSDVVIDEDALRAHLLRSLPDYMVPNAFVSMTRFPLTVNGKLDRNALPAPDFRGDEKHYVAPRTALESQMCSIWQTVLGVEKVGVHDDFFYIGGDSIRSIQLITQLRKASFDCYVKDIFSARTISGLLELLLGREATINIDAEQGLLVGEFDLLPIQSWFFAKVDSGNFRHYGHWNQSFLVKIPELGIDQLAQCIPKLAAHHDILRVRFSRQSGQWKQCYLSEIDLPELKVVDVSSLSKTALSHQLTAFQSHFDIEQGPLWCMGYLHGYQDNTARIFFAFHHLIIDTVSWRILIADLKTLLSGYPLGKKTSSYRQWVNTITGYMESHSEERVYWKHLSDKLPDYNKKFHKQKQQVNQTISLCCKVTQQLLQKANAAYSTDINVLLLTALAYTLHHWQGDKTQWITLEGHGREHISESIDVSNTLGWFTAVHPVKLELCDNLKNSIKGIKDYLQQIPNKGIGFGAMFYKAGELIQENILSPIVFNYLGQFDTDHALWQLAQEDAGMQRYSKNDNSNSITINGMVISGQLHFNFETPLGKKETQIMANRFKAELERITAHCVEQGVNQESVNSLSIFINHKEYIPYEIVNDDAQGVPLFIFPPASGGAESYYNNLVPALLNHKIVLFNNLMNFIEEQDSRIYESLTFEQLAECYIHLIQAIQPKGPYRLCGWSFGGVLAFEIAKQLGEQGSEVQHLILIDPHFNYRKVCQEVVDRRLLADLPQNYSNINYRYDPDKNSVLNNTNISLFRATKVDESEAPKLARDQQYKTTTQEPLIRSSSSGRREEGGGYLEERQIMIDMGKAIMQYYAEETSDNHIGDYINSDKLVVIPLDCHHFNILEKTKDIISICNETVA